MSTINFEIINLDAPDLSSNDRDTYEAMLECMLAAPVESEVEALEFTAHAAATSVETAVPTDEGPTSGATTVGQLTSGQARGVGGPVPSAAAEAAEVALGDPATGTELALVMSSAPTVGEDSATTVALESSSFRPAAPVDETTRAASPSLPTS
jgi:hypothetical protein